MNMTNNDIVAANYNLIKTCCRFQATKYSLPFELWDDLTQMICLVLLEYDNEKLNRIIADKHLNAFITGILVRQLYSKNSPFYREFRKFQQTTSSIDDMDLNKWSIFQ